MKIGITERGDAGIDLSWAEKLQNGNYDGAVLITKNITQQFIEKVMRQYHAGQKLVVHATCTGWGGTVIEPNVPPFRDQLDHLKDLCDKGFPLSNCVLRIDPILPSPNGIRIISDIFSYAEDLGLIPAIRIRISIYDEYKHVKERLHQAGLSPLYPGDAFYASTEQFKNVASMLAGFPYTFYTCAEPKLLRYTKCGQVIPRGCISEDDLEIMGIKIPANLSVNKQNRNGCLCLSCKTELLDNRKQCPHKCIYCYWKDA